MVDSNSEGEISKVRFCRPIPKMVDKKTFEEILNSYSKEELEFYLECVDKHYWSRGIEFPLDDD